MQYVHSVSEKRIYLQPYVFNINLILDA